MPLRKKYRTLALRLHRDTFKLELARSVLVLTVIFSAFGTLSVSDLTAQEHAKPFHGTKRIEPSTIFELQNIAEEFRFGRGGEHALVVNLPVRDDTVAVHFAAHDIRSPDYRSTIVTDQGVIEDQTKVDLFIGAMKNTNTNDRSFARLALITTADSRQELKGFLSYRGSYYSISSDTKFHQAQAHDLTIKELLPSELEELIATCEAHLEAPHDAEGPYSADANALSPPVAQSTTMKQAQIATDSDYEYTLASGGAAEANAQILAVINGVDGIYTSTFNVTFEVTYQNAWATSSDPYDATDISALLSQFRQVWQSNFSSSHTYDLAHLFTGRNLSGTTIGMAWVGALCGQYRYGVSERYTSASYSVPLAAHEIGHNFDAEHDACISSDSWIMCPNLRLNASQFSPGSQAQVNSYLATVSCLSSVSSSGPSIASASPPSRYVDPRSDRNPATGALQGPSTVSITFSEYVVNASGSAPTLSNFQIKYYRNGVQLNASAADLATLTSPTVQLVSGSGAGPYLLRWTPRLPLGSWTVIEAVNLTGVGGDPIQTTNGANKVTTAFLPMDISGDGIVLGNDINTWLGYLNGALNPSPLGINYYCDQDRSGGPISGNDITRALQLLNGVATHRAWSNFQMGSPPQ